MWNSSDGDAELKDCPMIWTPYDHSIQYKIESGFLNNLPEVIISDDYKIVFNKN